MIIHSTEYVEIEQDIPRWKFQVHPTKVLDREENLKNTTKTHDNQNWRS